MPRSRRVKPKIDGEEIRKVLSLKKYKNSQGTISVVIPATYARLLQITSGNFMRIKIIDNDKLIMVKN